MPSQIQRQLTILYRLTHQNYSSLRTTQFYNSYNILPQSYPSNNSIYNSTYIKYQNLIRKSCSHSIKHQRNHYISYSIKRCSLMHSTLHPQTQMIQLSLINSSAIITHYHSKLTMRTSPRSQCKSYHTQKNTMIQITYQYSSNYSLSLISLSCNSIIPSSSVTHYKH